MNRIVFDVRTTRGVARRCETATEAAALSREVAGLIGVERVEIIDAHSALASYLSADELRDAVYAEIR